MTFNKLAAILCVIVVALPFSWQKSTPSDPTYQAAVVEFPPSELALAKDRVHDNLRRMKALIESSDTIGLDILVFPEHVLNNMEMQTFVPDPEQQIAPCEMPDYDFFLTELSCSARSRDIYVVVNIVEKEYCGNGTGSKTDLGCDPSGYNAFNTNVVFDRRGRVISRYRKTHLYRYEWYSIDVLAEPELAVFETDFGVKFGHFICFDMLFYEPAMRLIREMNITDIIFPTYWFSELPFLTAVQIQEGWAFANNVNLLAADGSLPAKQNTGSGIYAGRHGRLVAGIFEQPTTRTMNATVPKHGSDYQLPPYMVEQFQPQFQTSRFTQLDLLRDYNVDIFETRLLANNFTQVNETVCHEQFCCRFDIQRVLISNGAANTYNYRLVAYHGDKTTHQRMDRSELAVCAVVACTNDQLYSCGKIFPLNTVVNNAYYFQTINVNAIFSHAEKRLIMPTSVDGVMMPLNTAFYDMTETESAIGTEVNMHMKYPKNDVLTFGIYANYYTEHVTRHNLNGYWVTKTVEKSAATNMKSNICGFAFALLILAIGIK